MKETFNQLTKDLSKALEQVSSQDGLEEVRVEFLGRKGKMAAAMTGLKDLDDARRKEAGRAANDAAETF